LAVSAPLQAAAERPTFTVGTATAAQGHKAAGYLEVPAGVDAGLRIPVVVFHGAWPGPVLAIVSGAHGTEYASIIAVERLAERVDPTELSGSLILLPLVNIPSFEQKVPHVNPIDGKSMNRFYPGRPEGTQSERAAYAITKNVVEQCDHLIDLHGGDLDESLRPYSYWSKTGNAAQDAVSRDMALAFGLDHIIVVTDRPKDPASSRYLDNTASTPDGYGRRRGSGAGILFGDAPAEDASRSTIPRRAPGLDRERAPGPKRAGGNLLSAGRPRPIRRARNEDRVRDGFLWKDDIRSAIARCRCGALCLRGSVDEKRGHDRQHRSRRPHGPLSGETEDGRRKTEDVRRQTTIYQA
jgi:hypothetical protein